MGEEVIKALESVVRLGSLLLTQAIEKGQLTPTQIIACDGLVKPWAPGPFTKGDVRTEGGQTWKCVQSHDSTATPDWTPTNTRALWVPYHTTDPTRAKPYIAPTMAEDAYNTGECMIWTDGTVRRAKQDSVVHDPDTLPAAWETVELTLEV